MLEGPAISEQDSQRISQQFQAFSARLDHTDEERLVLKMAFQDGLKGTTIAERLMLPKHRPGRLLKSALKKTRTALLASGVDVEAIKQLIIKREDQLGAAI